MGPLDLRSMLYEVWRYLGTFPARQDTLPRRIEGLLVLCREAGPGQDPRCNGRPAIEEVSIGTEKC